MLISIIIPVLNESTTLSQALEELMGTVGEKPGVEILVCDGGSHDGSVNLAGEYPVRVLNSDMGRARQMNEGAKHASGDWLVFLHIDTHLPDNWISLIQNCLASWGRFDVRLTGRHWLFRVIEKAINIRSRKTSVATGDQVLFFQRDFFAKLNGFPEIPLMEDIAITKSARKLAPPANIRQPVATSSRRWEENGIIRTVLLMWFLRFAYWLGTKPETLARLYRS